VIDRPSVFGHVGLRRFGTVKVGHVHRKDRSINSEPCFIQLISEYEMGMIDTQPSLVGVSGIVVLCLGEYTVVSRVGHVQDYHTICITQKTDFFSNMSCVRAVVDDALSIVGVAGDGTADIHWLGWVIDVQDVQSAAADTAARRSFIPGKVSHARVFVDDDVVRLVRPMSFVREESQACFIFIEQP